MSGGFAQFRSVFDQFCNRCEVQLSGTQDRNLGYHTDFCRYHQVLCASGFGAFNEGCAVRIRVFRHKHQFLALAGILDSSDG